ncbi:hypothetical protein FACS1894208_05610 [Clostridia bacterium]|nr:hypothetical protein FACS1894208_05610 [Clostridia bacterium]
MPIKRVLVIILTLMLLSACAAEVSPAIYRAVPTSVEVALFADSVSADITGGGVNAEVRLFNDEKPYLSAIVSGGEYRVAVQPEHWDGFCYLMTSDVDGDGADEIVVVFGTDAGLLISLYKWNEAGKTFVPLPVPRNGAEGEWLGGFGLPSCGEYNLGYISRVETSEHSVEIHQQIRGSPDFLTTAFVADEHSYTITRQERS